MYAALSVLIMLRRNGMNVFHATGMNLGGTLILQCVVKFINACTFDFDLVFGRSLNDVPSATLFRHSRKISSWLPALNVVVRRSFCFSQQTTNKNGDTSIDFWKLFLMSKIRLSRPTGIIEFALEWTWTDAGQRAFWFWACNQKCWLKQLDSSRFAAKWE